MRSRADTIKGQGVLSAYEEQVSLVSGELAGRFQVSENQSGRYDITHFHTINLGYFLSLPFVKLHGAAVGYVHFLPETLESSIKLPGLCKAVFYRYVIRFYKSMDYLVTVNPDFVEKLAAYGIPKEKIRYIPNFVSSEEFYPVAGEERGRLRREYDIDNDAFVVLCVGQLQKRKGFFDFLEVAKRLPQVTFLWAGDFAFGAISDGYKEIREAAKNLPENVRLLGLVERGQMNGLYNLSDVMFLPSYGELFPMTILEAMNCSTPILVRDLSLYENILFDFYLKGHDNDDFVREIERLRQSPAALQAAREMSHQGHIYYSRESVARMWNEFYETVYERQTMKQKRSLPHRAGKAYEAQKHL
ncbi:1,2-diacylglycerol-3-alpha-glucose alpha-1,2-galactosyltransferase [Harryflintia acetispora]|uniref:1,2-diacylglycerol-3-alpha-glucose alpha-1,2-galactosyltransferase n=2 Tax=Eubacteriales TaxID=186802 RepID=A0A9X8ULQ3_9FIRM|nr:1,2-diacylglycerol-3-alpha-glucose alpha-1,2-galactosyltransferase [Harryflintia acetispora]